ncbi:MAG: 50S ribosomal protein L18, partial [Verrucomicrobiota bacterium]
MSQLNRKEVRRRIHKRIRRKVEGTPERPRLAVHYSNQHVYAQIIDDEAGKTLVSASTLDKSVEKSASNVASA